MTLDNSKAVFQNSFSPLSRFWENELNSFNNFSGLCK